MYWNYKYSSYGYLRPAKKNEGRKKEVQGRRKGGKEKGKNERGMRKGRRGVTPELSETGSWQAMKVVFLKQLKIFFLAIIMFPCLNNWWTCNMFRRCAKCFASFISVNSPYETTPSVKLPVMGLCLRFSVKKTEAQRGCDLPEGTFQHTEYLVQCQSCSLLGLWDTTLCGFQVSSAADQSHVLTVSLPSAPHLFTHPSALVFIPAQKS